MVVVSSIQQPQPNRLDLPPEILELVFQKIAVSVVDMMRFKAVYFLWCKSSNSYMSSASYSKLVSQTETAPWLMITIYRSSYYSFSISIEEQKMYRFKNMVRDALLVVGTDRHEVGWYFMIRHSTYVSSILCQEFKFYSHRLMMVVLVVGFPLRVSFLEWSSCPIPPLPKTGGL